MSVHQSLHLSSPVIADGHSEEKLQTYYNNSSLSNSSYNTLTMLRTSVKESLQMHFNVVVGNFPVTKILSSELTWNVTFMLGLVYALLSGCKFVIAILKHLFLSAALDHVISKCFLRGHAPRLPLACINNAPLLSYSNLRYHPTPLGLCS